MKKRSQEPLHEPSFTEWLQEVESRICKESISASQQQNIMQTLMQVFHVYTQARVHSSPGEEIGTICGQFHVKRALEIAAAGRHNILLVGPPGTEKARLARILPSLLPGRSLPSPFREPPSGSDRSAFIGNPEAPGELILAHDGVLSIQNLHTFDQPILTILAQVVETHAVSIPLNKSWVKVPSRFLLAATLKPCPCGWSGNPTGSCYCSAQEIAHYRQRLFETVHTCFALEVEVPLREGERRSQHAEESPARIRKRVEAARALQHRRYARERHIRVNADLGSADEVQRYCSLDSSGEELLATAHRQLHLTPLQGLRVQAVARTIADLAGSPTIAARHLAEAIQYIPRFGR